MHVRFSDVRGSPVLDDQTQIVVAMLGEPLIHPDTGRIEGFFVYGVSPEFPGMLFLQSHDIITWGANVHVRSGSVLSPPQDLIRLQERLSDPRSFLHQRMRIEEERTSLGVCADVQFDTRHLVVEWLFPRKFLWYRQPIPASDILEVTPEAIWIRHPLRPKREKVVLEKSEDAPTIVPEILPVQTRAIVSGNKKPSVRRVF